MRAISALLLRPLPPLDSSMASSSLPSRTFYRHSLPSSAPPPPSRGACAAACCCLRAAVSRRRAAAQLLSAAGFLIAVSPPSLAARRGRMVVSLEDYVTSRTLLVFFLVSDFAIRFGIKRVFLVKNKRKGRKRQ